MPAKIFSASLFGFDCRTVEVEVDILNGTSSITIVGLGDASVQESKERIRSAIKNSGLEYPRRKKTINLAPAHLRKHGPLFDLPIALGLIMKSEQLSANALDGTLVIGELALSGNLRPVFGALPITDFARRNGFKKIIIPESNGAEAALVEGIEIIAVKDLISAVKHLRHELKIESPQAMGYTPNEKRAEAVWRFEDIHGQEYAKRALTIAAAGSHNVLLFGPPGSGKTILARSLQGILPPLQLEEAIEVTKIHSIAGRISEKEPLIYMPPFRAVHHTASTISFVGGGTIPRPGEISLAHMGVLFLDELLEFPRGALDCLRQPLEEGAVMVTRVAGSCRFPAEFILLAATNPCPCGHAYDSGQRCTCLPSHIKQYQKRLSGPLLDRIDMVVQVPRLPFETINRTAGGLSSEIVLKQVIRARLVQMERLKGASSLSRTNGRMSSAEVRAHCVLSENGMQLLKEAFSRFRHSGRSYYRILKVARTIADLENAPSIEHHHLAEALQYRPRFLLENEQ